MALHTRVLRLVLSGLMGALLVVSKQAMSGLPNIEPVTLLVILFALELPRETPGAVTVFILLQGVLYGFGLWWAMYLYVWYLLALLAWLLRRMDNALGWAVFSGIYGLCFGGRAPPRVAQEAVVGRGEIESETTGFQTDQEQWYIFLLEARNGRLSLFATATAIKVTIVEFSGF